MSYQLVFMQREHFPFLEEYKCSRSRTTFYYTIGWLIFMEDSPIKFKSSMDPLLQVRALCIFISCSWSVLMFGAYLFPFILFYGFMP